MYRILVIDATDDASPVIPYLFREADCHVDIFCPKRSAFHKHRYYDNWFEGEADNPMTFIESLHALLRRTEYDWVFPANDRTNRFLNKTVTDDELAQKILPLSKIEHRLLLGSKAGLTTLCQQYDIPSPQSAIYDGYLDPYALATRLGYPLLLKEDHSAAGVGVYFCADEAELSRSFDRLSVEKRKNLVFQKYIPGKIIAVEALYKKGQLLAHADCIATKTMRDEFGASMERHYHNFDGLEMELALIGERFGINGFCTMTFMEEMETGQRYLIEADQRPQVWFRYAKFCGVDFSLAIRDYLEASHAPIRKQSKIKEDGKPIVMWHFFRHIRNFANHGVDWAELYRWALNVDGRWRFIPWYGWRYLFQAFRKI